jgi:hypothetical protein
MDSAAYTAPYVAGWAGGDVKKVRASAEHVVKTAGMILAGLTSEERADVLGEVAA